MFSPRINQSVPKLNVPKKLRAPNSSASMSNGPSRSAKGIFRQWGDPPPPPLVKTRITEQRTQSLPPVKRRPGSADPRFRRRIDKTDSNLTIDPSNTSLIGDCKKTTITHCKSENVSPRKINGEGEISDDICKRTEDVKEFFEQTKQALESEIINNKTNVADKTEQHLPTVEQPKQVEQLIISEPEKVATKLTDYDTPSVSFMFEKVNEPVCKADTPKCADENLESKFHDHMFYSTLSTRYVPCLEKEKLSGSDIEDNMYEKYLKERVKMCTSQSLIATPLYVEEELMKNVDADEEDDVTCNTTKVKLQVKSKNRDLTLICGSAVIFGASVWYYFGSHIDVDELSKSIPWLQPKPEPSMLDYFTSAAGFLLESCASVVSFVYNILTVSLEEEME